MPVIAHGDIVTRVSTTQQHPLGFTVELPPAWAGTRAGQGRQVWIYVQNSEAATAYVAGHVVSRATTAVGPPVIDAATYQTVRVPANFEAEAVLGVAQHAIPFGGFGFILREGIGEVLADAAGYVTMQSLIVGTAVGTAITRAAVGDSSFGFSIEAAVGAVLATCMINCKG